MERRQALIRNYCKDMKRKRYALAYRRFVKTKARQLNIHAEANLMLNHEIDDKHLRRTYYYGPDEPAEMVYIHVP